jgi:hypothetical protein
VRLHRIGQTVQTNRDSDPDKIIRGWRFGIDASETPPLRV